MCASVLVLNTSPMAYPCTHVCLATDVHLPHPWSLERLQVLGMYRYEMSNMCQRMKVLTDVETDVLTDVSHVLDVSIGNFHTTMCMIHLAKMFTSY